MRIEHVKARIADLATGEKRHRGRLPEKFRVQGYNVVTWSIIICRQANAKVFTEDGWPETVRYSATSDETGELPALPDASKKEMIIQCRERKYFSMGGRSA
ncbi:MAG: hypothetical protein ACLUD2_10995 [Clostridium sp.]